MDSKLPVGSAVEQILKNVDLASIQDERARECIRLLLNLIESLTAELRKARAENQYLREQLQRRQGGGGKAGGKPGSPDPSAPASRSSERERAEASEKKPHTKCSKLDRIHIDREEVLRVDPAKLPADGAELWWSHWKPASAAR